MAINFFPAEYEVIRNADRCIASASANGNVPTKCTITTQTFKR